MNHSAGAQAGVLGQETEVLIYLGDFWESEVSEVSETWRTMESEEGRF